MFFKKKSLVTTFTERKTVILATETKVKLKKDQVISKPEERIYQNP